MPGRRSYHTALATCLELSQKQRDRRVKDLFFRAAASSPSMALMEVPRRLKPQFVSMRNAKLLHMNLDAIIGQAASSAKVSAARALRAGFISRDDNKKFRKIFEAGDARSTATLISRSLILSSCRRSLT